MADLATGGSESKYEVVIGLETHVHLRTVSKLFSPAPVLYGEDANHSVHPVCLALPGVLPVINRHAVELAIRAYLTRTFADQLDIGIKDIPTEIDRAMTLGDVALVEKSGGRSGHYKR